MQGIINMNRNGNSANFFSHVCNGKKIKELFVSSLIGITADVKCASSIILVLNGELTQLIAANANKKDSQKRKSPRKVSFFASRNNI